MQKLQTALNQHISASRAASTILKKTKLSTSKNLEDELILVSVVLYVSKWQIEIYTSS